MPKGYVIFIEDIRDRTRYEQYLEKAVPMVLQSGGRPIIASDDAEVIEGKWPGRRTVVLEFDSVGAARQWYEMPEYQAIIGERNASTEGDANAAILSGM